MKLGRMYDGKRNNSEMTAIMDAGFERGRTVLKTYFVKGKRKNERLHVFGPKSFLQVWMKVKVSFQGHS